jgi:hydrogenase maturation protease
MTKIVIVAVGNIILGDEGVGIHVLNRLRLQKLPREVELVEGGVGGLALLTYIRGANSAIFIDAVAGRKPGRIHRLTEAELEREVKTILHPMSLHDIGLAETVKIGKTIYPGEMPEKIVIYGIEIGQLEKYTTELSKEVDGSVDKVVKLIIDELGSFRIEKGGV